MSSELTAREDLRTGHAVLQIFARRRAALWATISSFRPAALLSLVVPALLFTLWLIAAERHWMSPQILPSPALVFQTAGELLSDNLLSNLAISLQRLVIGLAAGVLAGAALGAWIGLSRRAEAVIYPTFIAIVQVPTLAWVPFFMMLIGLGEALIRLCACQPDRPSTSRRHEVSAWASLQPRQEAAFAPRYPLRCTTTPPLRLSDRP